MADNELMDILAGLLSDYDSLQESWNEACLREGESCDEDESDYSAKARKLVNAHVRCCKDCRHYPRNIDRYYRTVVVPYKATCAKGISACSADLKKDCWEA